MGAAALWRAAFLVSASGTAAHFIVMADSERRFRATSVANRALPSMTTNTRMVLGLLFAALGAAGAACGGGDAGRAGDAGPDAGPPSLMLPDVALPSTWERDGSEGPADAAQIQDGGAADGSTDAPPDTGSVRDGGGEDAAPDCGAAPTLHYPGDASIFCPFAVPFGQPPLRCAATEECCETLQDAGVPGTCQAKGAVCPVARSTRWECQDAVNCPAGQTCCAVGSDGGAVTLDPNGACGLPRMVGFEGTRCGASCGASALAVCESPASCPAGTCRPLHARGVEIGVCQ